MRFCVARLMVCQTFGLGVRVRMSRLNVAASFCWACVCVHVHVCRCQGAAACVQRRKRIPPQPIVPVLCRRWRGKE